VENVESFTFSWLLDAERIRKNEDYAFLLEKVSHDGKGIIFGFFLARGSEKCNI
jgi:hypothetical protein